MANLSLINMQTHINKVVSIDKKKLSSGDFSLFCPPKGENFWRMHPRVYLDIKNRDNIICQYCGTKYIIKS